MTLLFKYIALRMRFPSLPLNHLMMTKWQIKSVYKDNGLAVSQG